MTAQPKRILIAAENASTRFGGEAILPYHYFRLLRERGLDVHLVVHARTREELIATFPNDLDRLHFVKDQLLQKLFYRLGKLLPARIAEATFGLANNFLTQLAQRRILRKLVTPNTVVHQPIPVSPRFPSLIYGLKAPVVIGPLNGGMEYPPAFRQSESALSRILIALGRSLTNPANWFFPGKRRAAIILVANERTRAVLPSKLKGQVLTVVENAVDTQQWGLPPAAPGDDARFVFFGRLVDWKALDIVIDAINFLPHTTTLDVIGDGPMYSKWRKMVAHLGLRHRIHFRGWLPQAECANYLHNCTALLLPSIYECGGAVVLEAMTLARPVIATAWGGPLQYLDKSCGYLIPPTTRTALVSGFANAMRDLMSSPDLRQKLGAAAQQKIRNEFDWTHKIDRILEIYDQALQSNK